MISKRMALQAVVCGILLLFSATGVPAADFTVTVSNSIQQVTNEQGTCQPVSVTCWSSNGNGSRQQLPNALGYSSQTVTFRKMTCDAVDIVATCHYFQKIYTNKGSMSETSYGHWTDETKAQSFSGCHAANIGITENAAGNTTYQVLSITCQ